MLFYDGIIFSLQRNGGISVLFNEILSRLQKDSYKIECYNNNNSIVEPGSSYYKKPRMLERYRDVRGVSDKSIFHSTYYRLPENKKSKIVTTVHDFTYERYIKGASKLIHTYQKNRSIRYSDKIICVSESTKQDLLEFVGSDLENKITVIPNGVSNKYYPLDIDLKMDPYQVLFVGARTGYKNFHSVVDALSIIDGAVLLCVGGGDFTKAERRHLDRCIPHKYKHSGYISEFELNFEYNKSLCLIYPSLYEGFGIPVLEAMSAGCPVIACNNSSIPEVAGNAAILLQVGDPDEIRIGINELLDLSRRSKYIQKGLLRSALFSWDDTYTKTASLYDELILL